MYSYDWSEIAFSNKTDLNKLYPIFIAAPREISDKRFIQLVKQYLPTANILVGIAKEEYINGFDGQPQFKTLPLNTIKRSIDRVNKSYSENKIYIINYFQRDLQFILEKIKIKSALFINGSWKHVFHSRPEYFALTANKIEYKLVSPFCDENEARTYESRVLPKEVNPSGLFTDREMLRLADEISKRSFDYPFQTGVTLGLKKSSKYQFITQSFNKVVPYQTYAMLNGSTRETNFALINDLNYYDTIHAEANLIVQAQRRKLSIKNTILFTNLLPCPTCALMLCETDISGVVYRADHSEGYSVKVLQDSGKTVRRLV